MAHLLQHHRAMNWQKWPLTSSKQRKHTRFFDAPTNQLTEFKRGKCLPRYFVARARYYITGTDRVAEKQCSERRVCVTGARQVVWERECEPSVCGTEVYVSVRYCKSECVCE